MSVKLYGYWRSSAAYRLRIALNLKGIEYEQVSINLKDGEQTGDAWLNIQPQGLVPVLEVDGQKLVQSPAILEWIEETWPTPPLLPTDASDRALVRGWAAAIGCDIHPVQNLRILKAAAAIDGSGLAGMKAWANTWISRGLDGLEALVAAHPREGAHLFGDAPGMAEIYLVPQLYNARRWGVDVSQFPTLAKAEAAALALPALQAAEPERQPDAVVD